ncbi:MAG: LEA type 2 family protein [Sphingobacteriales bacterium]|nr:LEA type 2 family protein [Sphingobacteriales bacterium]
MKRMFFFLVIVAALAWAYMKYRSAAVPQFQRVENMSLSGVSLSKITLKGDAIFKNDNNVGCTMSGIDLDVFANGVKVGKIENKDAVTISGNSEFDIPLYVSFSPASFLKEKNILSNILSAYENKKVEVYLKGNINVLLAGVSVPIPMAYKDSVAIGGL